MSSDAPDLLLMCQVTTASPGKIRLYQLMSRVHPEDPRDVSSQTSRDSFENDQVFEFTLMVLGYGLTG